MRDSLLSRFRSGFLGAVLGEGFLVETSPLHSSRLGQTQVGDFRPQATALMLSQVQQWLQAAPQSGSALLPDASTKLPTEKLATEKRPTDLAELALTLVPVALFYHDQPRLLQAMLHQWAIQAQLTDATALSMGVTGQIVALILRERFMPTQLIPQLVRDLDGLGESSLLPQLGQVQIWLEQSVSLAEVAQEFRRAAVQPGSAIDPVNLTWLMALYSFLSTPEQFQLTMGRLARLPGCQPGAGALAGVWSGLYNGLAGIPLGWRQQAWTSDWAMEPPTWSIRSESDLFDQADQLLAVWSGTAQLQQWFQLPQHATLIASPRMIR